MIVRTCREEVSQLLEFTESIISARMHEKQSCIRMLRKSDQRNTEE